MSETWLDSIHMPLETAEEMAKLLGYRNVQVVKGALLGELNGLPAAPPEVFDRNLLALAELRLEWQQRLRFIALLIETAGTASMWTIRHPELHKALKALLEAARLPVGN